MKYRSGSIVRRWRVYAVVAVALAAGAFAVQAIASNPDPTQPAALSVAPYEGHYWGHTNHDGRFVSFTYIGDLRSGTIHNFRMGGTPSPPSQVTVRDGQFNQGDTSSVVVGHWCSSHHLTGRLGEPTPSGVVQHHWHAHWPNARFYPDRDPNEDAQPCP